MVNRAYTPHVYTYAVIDLLSRIFTDRTFLFRVITRSGFRGAIKASVPTPVVSFYAGLCSVSTLVRKQAGWRGQNRDTAVLFIGVPHSDVPLNQEDTPPVVKVLPPLYAISPGFGGAPSSVCSGIRHLKAA